MSERILVTGSRGLIGRSLCPVLRHAGYTVLELDSAIPAGESGHGDVRDSAACAALIAQAAGVIHLAAVSRVVWGERDPALCVAVNAQASQALLSACIAAPHQPWFLLASSREVYGQQSSLPVSEDAVLQPLNVYARSKLAAEEAVNAAAKQGLRAGVARLSSVYGDEFDHHTRVLPAFVRAALSGQPLRVDDAAGMLDFTYAREVAVGLVRYAQLLASGRQISPIHFVSGIGTSLADLAHMVIELANSTSEMQRGEPRTYDVARFVGDCSKARNILGWQSSTPLAQGIQEMLACHHGVFQAKVENGQ